MHWLSFVSSDGREIDKVNRTIDDITERWNCIKVELTSLGTTLEEILENWQRYNVAVDHFRSWFTKAERMASEPDHKAKASQCFSFSRSSTLACLLCVLSVLFNKELVPRCYNVSWTLPHPDCGNMKELASTQAVENAVIINQADPIDLCFVLWNLLGHGIWCLD